MDVHLPLRQNHHKNTQNNRQNNWKRGMNISRKFDLHFLRIHIVWFPSHSHRRQQSPHSHIHTHTNTQREIELQNWENIKGACRHQFKSFAKQFILPLLVLSLLYSTRQLHLTSFVSNFLFNFGDEWKWPKAVMRQRHFNDFLYHPKEKQHQQPKRDEREQKKVESVRCEG